MKRYFLIIVLFCWHIIAWATITTQVDPSTVRMGETFRLTITMEAPQADSIPDLTPLQENFSIVGTERSMAYSIINGQRHSVNQWMVLLTPLKTGTLLIPAIQIGQQQTNASSIEVTAGPRATPTPSSNPSNNAANDLISLKTEINSHDIYINQQAIYTVRLYNSQRLIDAEYKPPRVEDSLMIPLGESHHYQTIINNREYAVEEQQYAVFPQKSGNLTIFPPQFNAVLYDSVPRKINVHGKQTALNVKPIPSSYKGKQWLPATQVALTEVYDQAETSMNQGSTLIRTITLQAAGVPAQLLPTLEFESTSQFNAYPEKPELRNSTRQQEIIGRADVKVTYLLNKSGPVTIPALNVHWFNTDTQKEEIASLPERIIDVKASENTQQKPPPLAPSKKAAVQPLKPPPLLKKSDHIAWAVAGGFALAWLTTLIWLWWRKNSSGKWSKKRGVLKQLHQACINNNPIQAQEALLRWGNLQWPNSAPINLHHVAKLVHGTPLKKQLSLLSQALYSEGKNKQWQGKALWRAMTIYLRKKPTPKHKKSGLPPINPE